MSESRTERAPWLLLPAALLTLSGVTLLAPRQAALAAPAQAAPKPGASALEDDGDGDELLEHWGDPKYGGEERLQMAGMAGGFLLIGGLACGRRVRGRARVVTRAPESVTEQRKAA